MKFENTDVWGFRHALRGMRNPMESWDKSDSSMNSDYFGPCDCAFEIGGGDIGLAQKLTVNGPEHRKFLRQIMVSVDITAPLFWWKEFDVYKIGIVSNSTSTMHKLATTPISIDCFEIEDYAPFKDIPYTGEKRCDFKYCIDNFISMLEILRLAYLDTKDQQYWRELIRWLPESWLQLRTVTMNYENIRNMVHQRKNHKLKEWSVSFINWAEGLPFAEELIFYDGDGNDSHIFACA